MTKPTLSKISSVNTELLNRATPEDWAHVRSTLNLSRQQCYSYRMGKALKHKLNIERELLRSIANREKRNLQHKKKIASILSAPSHIEEEDIIGVAEHMSRKFEKGIT